MVQSQSVRIMCRLKGRRGVTTEAKKILQLDTRRKNSRLKLLHKILSGKHTQPVLWSSSYDDIMNQPKATVQTRSQSGNEPGSISTARTCFYNHFLSHTIRGLKI